MASVLLESVEVHFSIVKCPRISIVKCPRIRIAKVIENETTKCSMQFQHSGPFGYAGLWEASVAAQDRGRRRAGGVFGFFFHKQILQSAAINSALAVPLAVEESYSASAISG
jgi:hypothetical protein